jgi:hypothetical protein
LQLCTSFLIKPYLFTSAFSMSRSDTNLLKFDVGIPNDLSILFVNGDNNFTAAAGQHDRCDDNEVTL